ncbi:MAG: HEAT repeat domain-containing protein [Elusimicrobia bacterium]|nr:HEAT repeat domain-containing protein [Elusimicrobiota bacterium]
MLLASAALSAPVEPPPAGPEPLLELIDLAPDGSEPPNTFPYRDRGDSNFIRRLWNEHASAFGEKDWDESAPGLPRRRVVLMWEGRRIVLQSSHPFAPSAKPAPKRLAFDALVHATEVRRAETDRGIRGAAAHPAPDPAPARPPPGPAGERARESPPARPRTAPGAFMPAAAILLGLLAMLWWGVRRMRGDRPAQAAAAPQPAAPEPAPIPRPAPAAPEPPRKGPSRLALGLSVPLLAYEIHNFLWISAGDAWAARGWSHALLVLGIMAGALLLVEGLYRLGGGAAKGIAGTLFVLSLLVSPIFALMPLTGWGVPTILPNKQGFSQYPNLPENVEPLGPAFAEIRLIFRRYKSIMQGTSRVVYVVGTPHPHWVHAFESMKGSTTEGFRPCPITLPSAWDRGECPVPAEGRTCFHCKSGNWNHSVDSLIVFDGGGERAVLYAGTGPAFRDAAKDAGILELAGSNASLRYPPARSDANPEDQAMFARLASTGTFSGPLTESEKRRISACLFGRDLQCLDAYLRTDPTGKVLEPFLDRGIPFERLSAAIALARVKHPRALTLLLEPPRDHDPFDSLVRVADALSRYGPEAAPALPWLKERFDVFRPNIDEGFLAGMAVAMLRMGTPESLDYIAPPGGAIAPSDLRAIEEAFRRIESPSSQAIERLHQWIRRQRKHKPADALPLLKALRGTAGLEALRPYQKWIGEMRPKNNARDEWAQMYDALSRASSRTGDSKK